MNKKGFTLIELMIVVAIIGILTAIAVPKFQEVMACGGDKKDTIACRTFKERHKKDVVATLPPPVPATNIFNTSDVQVINDATIGYKGHVYKRAD